MLGFTFAAYNSAVKRLLCDTEVGIKERKRMHVFFQGITRSTLSYDILKYYSYWPQELVYQKPSKYLSGFVESNFNAKFTKYV